LTNIDPLMKKPSGKNGTLAPARPIALVCVSKHKPAGPQAKEPDKLAMIRGKWAWCPSGAETGHDWKPVASGSLNDLRVQLVEVSRLVDVALNTKPVAKKPNKATQTRSRTKQR
jgi:hypothetical protein